MKTLTIDKYTVEIEIRGACEYLVRVYEGTSFKGKVITNNIEAAIEALTK